MSTYAESSWLRRLWSLARPGEPTTPFVSNVNLVNDMRYRSSRERAPYGRTLSISNAPAAGEFAGWEIRADDNLGPPVKLLHHLRVRSAGNGVCLWGIVEPTAALIADRSAFLYQMRDSDPDITLRLNMLSSAGGDVPSILLSQLHPDVSGVTGWFGILPFGDIPFAGIWSGTESLYVFAPAANEQVQIDVGFQAMRA